LAFRPVGKLSDFPEGSGRQVQVGTRRLAVFRLQGRLYVLKDFCPHEGEPLHLGRLDGASVVCRAHAWRFDLASGRCLRGEPESRVAAYPVKVEGETVLVDVG
jgi:nitrite reductase/ring-hydroxylating ferredoxin subunit